MGGADLDDIVDLDKAEVERGYADGVTSGRQEGLREGDHPPLPPSAGPPPPPPRPRPPPAIAGLGPGSAGRQLGVFRGFEVGQEVGFYAGCLAVWERQDGRGGGQAFSNRARQAMAALRRALDAVPVTDAGDERLTDLLSEARSRFKAVSVSLGQLAPHSELLGQVGSSVGGPAAAGSGKRAQVDADF